MNLWASVSPINVSFLRRALLIALAFVISYLWQHKPKLAITFIQQNYATPQSAKSTVPVTFTSAQTAGNLNVVVVGWNDTTATVSSVTDSKGNVYTRAVGPTVRSGQLSQAIYYAKNIQAAAANTNTVTVQFSVAANYADIRILEYNGLDASNPVDVTAAATGTTATSSSGAVTTANGNDLIFGANTVSTSTRGPGSGFTKRSHHHPRWGYCRGHNSLRGRQLQCDRAADRCWTLGDADGRFSWRVGRAAFYHEPSCLVSYCRRRIFLSDHSDEQSYGLQCGGIACGTFRKHQYWTYLWDSYGIRFLQRANKRHELLWHGQRRFGACGERGRYHGPFHTDGSFRHCRILKPD